MTEYRRSFIVTGLSPSLRTPASVRPVIPSFLDGWEQVILVGENPYKGIPINQPHDEGCKQCYYWYQFGSEGCWDCRGHDMWTPKVVPTHRGFLLVVGGKFKMVKDFQFKEAMRTNGKISWNIFWNRPFPANPEGYEVIYLGEAHRDGGGWRSHHISITDPTVHASRLSVAEYLRRRKIDNNLVCPVCGRMATVVGVEYSYDMPDHYDGVSEWYCTHDDTRWGRWSGKILHGEETEPRFGERSR